MTTTNFGTGGKGKWWGPLCRALALNAGGFLLVVAAGEVVVRAIPPAHTLPSNFKYVPGRTFRYVSAPRGPDGVPEFDVQVTMNRYGFHGPDHPPLRAEGKRRVVLIGDSMVEAFQVRREDGLAARLEASLPGTEVLGFGMSGHAAMRQGVILQRLPELLSENGRKDVPDITVFVVHGPYAVRQALVDHVRGPALWRRALAWSLREYTGPSLFLLRVRDGVLGGLFAPADDLAAEAALVSRPGYESDLLRRAWGLLAGAVENLVAEARKQGTRPVFAYIPDASEMGTARPDYDPRRFAGKFRELTSRTGADWIDISDEFRAAAPEAGGTCFFAYDQHPTPRGHALAARLLSERLRPLLVGPPPPR